MMAIALNGTLVEPINGKELHSNGFFDTVRLQAKKMPESCENPGYFKHDSVDESALMEPDNPIIAETPNTYKDYGVSVDNQGYFSFPRPISNDPRYKGARLKYKHVLHVILENAVFRDTTHSIGTEEIEVKVGQFCVTVRGLVELCNKGVRFKEDLVDKNVVERASHFWQTCGFVRQEVRHGKILLTVTVPEFYAKEKTVSETGSETKPRLNRDSKETHETQETINISSVADAPSEKKKVVSSSKKRKKVDPAPLVERDKGILTSDIAHEKLIQEKGSEQVVKEIYSAMAVWKAQNGIQGGDDFKTALRWSLTPKAPPRTYNRPAQPKYNHDTSPSLPSKSISFAEEV